jgi:hypothetical protein
MRGNADSFGEFMAEAASIKVARTDNQITFRGMFPKAILVLLKFKC